jgi:deoxyinosine 3'endonuclease (endonuclease V)
MKRVAEEERDFIDVDTIRYVGGVDISFITIDGYTDPYEAVACLVVFDLELQIVVYEDIIDVRLEVPYVPGYLGFREVPAFEQLLERNRLSNKQMPECILVDGQGALHYRHCGSAVHFGVRAGIPTVGVGKQWLKVGQWTPDEVYDYCNKFLGRRSGATLEIRDRIHYKNPTTRVRAIAVRGGDRCHSWWPVFVSPGYKVSMSGAARLVVRCCINPNHREPEPIFLADRKSRKHIREHVIPGRRACGGRGGGGGVG